MLRSNVALSFLLTFVICSAAAAEVHIPLSCRIKNRPPGRCGWCALETLARHHGIEALYNFTDRHPCDCSASSLEASLVQAGIHYRIQYPGSRSQKLLRYAIRWSLGAAVGVQTDSSSADGHVVTLIDLTASEVRYIDPNDADGRTRHMSLERFLSAWDGLAVVLIPEICWVRLPASERKLCDGEAACAHYLASQAASCSFPGKSGAAQDSPLPAWRKSGNAGAWCLRELLPVDDVPALSPGPDGLVRQLRLRASHSEPASTGQGS